VWFLEFPSSTCWPKQAAAAAAAAGAAAQQQLYPHVSISAFSPCSLRDEHNKPHGHALLQVFGFKRTSSVGAHGGWDRQCPTGLVTSGSCMQEL
jgi:hypothetical protein